MFYIALFVVLFVIGIRLYLYYADQHIHFHSQNLSREGHPQPTWRHGRCWWWLASNDDKKYRQGMGAHAEWSFFGFESFALTISILDDEGEDIQFHIGIPYLTSLWLSLDRLPFLEKIPYKWRRNFGYETGVKVHGGTLWLDLLYAEMWGAHRLRLRWLPTWISVHYSSGYKEYMGIGFYLSFDFDHLIFGSRHRDVEKIGDPIIKEIPIEPDNTMGFHYYATFQREAETRWRSHFPWRKTRTLYWEIETNNPPLHAGKGENSYDQDDDGIFGTSAFVETVEEAIAKYQKSVYRDRRKYGMPGNLPLEFHEVG